jgi:hypothetical protein
MGKGEFTLSEVDFRRVLYDSEFDIEWLIKAWR